MRLLTASSGRRLGTPTRFRIKGLNVVPSAANVTADGAGWGPMWNTWDWTGWIKPQIDLAKANGANLVKVTGSQATGAYPIASIFLDRAARFLDYAAQQGLLVYWNYASTDWGASVEVAAPKIQQLGALLDKFPHVIGLDLGNETGLQPANVQVGHVPALVAAARSVTSIPVTASVSCDQPAHILGSTAMGVLPHVDFMDFHPYYGEGHNPASADWNAYRALSNTKPWILGECGEKLEAGTGPQQTRWTSLGTISATAPDCYGAVGFSVADYSASARYGMYAADLITARTQITVPFAGWPTSAPY